MRLLLYEWCCSGGLRGPDSAAVVGNASPAGLITEGRLILEALANDAFQLEGCEVTILSDGLLPAASTPRFPAGVRGRKVADGEELDALLDAARDADWVYTDVWASMGQETEAEARRDSFRGFQINAALMKRARPDAIILHCLPAHYGEEIDYQTSRTPNSAIFDQAENRMHAQNALMVMLAT